MIQAPCGKEFRFVAAIAAPHASHDLSACVCASRSARLPACFCYRGPLYFESCSTKASQSKSCMYTVMHRCSCASMRTSPYALSFHNVTSMRRCGGGGIWGSCWQASASLASWLSVETALAHDVMYAVLRGGRALVLSLGQAAARGLGGLPASSADERDVVRP